MAKPKNVYVKKELVRVRDKAFVKREPGFIKKEQIEINPNYSSKKKQ